MPLRRKMKNLTHIRMKWLTKIAWIGFFLFVFFVYDAFARDIDIAVIDSGAVAYVDSSVSFTSFAASQDPLNHGTSVAKLIRQNFPVAKIHMLQVCENKDGTLKPSKAAVVKALQWCLDHNVDVINMSLVLNYDADIDQMITKAIQAKGIVVVAAAGNKILTSHFAMDSDGYVCKIPQMAKPAFPASSPGVISVGAVDRTGGISHYSHAQCDISEDGKIPGEEGTSFACARAAAKIGKLLSQNPKNLSKSEILSSLK